MSHGFFSLYHIVKNNRYVNRLNWTVPGSMRALPTNILSLVKVLASHAVAFSRFRGYYDSTKNDCVGGYL